MGRPYDHGLEHHDGTEGWAVYSGVEGDDPTFHAFFVCKEMATVFATQTDTEGDPLLCDPSVEMAIATSRGIFTANDFEIRDHTELRRRLARLYPDDEELPEQGAVIERKHDMTEGALDDCRRLLDKARGRARKEAHDANLLDEKLCDQLQRTKDLQAIVEQVRHERDEWADAIRTVAYGDIPSPHAARAAIAELRGKWEEARAERDMLARICGAVIVAATLQPGEELLDDTEDATVRAALSLVRQRNEALMELDRVRTELAKRDICWHCFDQLARYDDERPRCEGCPPECDLLGCQAPGCLGEEPVIG